MTESVALALGVCAVLAAVGTVVDACELIAAGARNRAAFRWEVLSTLSVRTWRRSRVLRLGRIGLHDGMQVARLIVAVGAALAWVATPSGWFGPVAAVGCLLLQLVVQNRLILGLDGADQMMVVVWAGLAIAGVSVAAGMTLIGGQAVLAYYAAGIAKLAGAEWRAGTAVQRIVSTATHGSRFAARLLAVRPVGRAASWATIAFEIGAPILLLGGFVGGLVFALVALAFHVSIAWVMGLNNFVWSFAAALPILFLAATQITVLG